jgi:hypothetical protein
MCIPDSQELCDPPWLEDDPLGEDADMPVPGLVHRYRDRALCLATTTCSSYCRHCTRKRIAGQRESTIDAPQLERMCGYLQEHPEIRDVIISGGDPLTMGDRSLERVVSAIRSVPAGVEPVSEGIVAMAHGARFARDAAGIRECEGGTAADAAREPRYLLAWRRAGELELLMARSRDATDPIAVMKPGQWSGWVRKSFAGRDCMRQYKLLELSGDGQRMAVYGTRAGACEGWGCPPGIEADVIANAGGYAEALELEGCGLLRAGNFGATCLEIMDLQARWMSDCAAHLATTQEWDAMFMQYHAPDGVSHAYLADLESPDTSATSRARAHCVARHAPGHGRAFCARPGHSTRALEAGRTGVVRGSGRAARKNVRKEHDDEGKRHLGHYCTDPPFLPSPPGVSRPPGHR